MSKQSAGLLVYRLRESQPEFLLVHPGGPYWKNRDAGAWSIPKGEFSDNEDPLAAARREFLEETGCTIDGEFQPLTPIKQRGGKTVRAWLVAADIDAAKIRSNTFAIEWPPRSGNRQAFPEVDRADWFSPATSHEKINEAQRPLLAEAEQLLAGRMNTE